MTTQQDLAVRFHALHDSASPLALTNVWDAASARIVEANGAAAVATTSAGVAWGLGAADGNRIDRNAVVALIRRVVAAVDLPVTADIESGFGATPAEVADTVARVLEAGAVGVNIEDGDGGDEPLRPTADAAERLAAARAAAERVGVPLYINARTDVFLRQVGEPEERAAHAIERARAYLAAGASGIFVPGVADPAVIGRLAAAIDAPLNIMVGPGSPSVPELGKLGVARASQGASVAMAAYGVVARAAKELAETGTYDSVREVLDYGTLNSLMGK